MAAKLDRLGLTSSFFSSRLGCLGSLLVSVVSPPRFWWFFACSAGP